MLTHQLLVLTQPQRDRPAFAELRVRFVGKTRHQHLGSPFGIQSAAAKPDLAAYKDLAPGNIDHDANAKSDLFGPHLRLAFAFPPERVLSWLNQGFGDGESVQIDACVASETPARLTQPDLTTLSNVPRAIHQACPLGTEYHSITSGSAHCDFVPLTLLDNGLRWHARTCNRKTQAFHLWLKGRLAIYRLKTAVLAAGYLSQPDQQRQEPAPSEGSYEDA